MRSVKSKASNISAFSFKSASSGSGGAAAGGGGVKSSGGFSLKPKIGLKPAAGGAGGAGGLGSLLKGGQWGTATPVEDGQADDDFDF